ncbi:DNA translocase FtsK [Falsiroseomonas oryzae]|uniref:DNA translocase FtsK n=1 Tax=Falsiroseomonas oryzae TaxID=2766473 RepID=UPI0022EADC03|nr:FtsK/SpoIIIE domain-containing protein [Roseomonas sp. MO-31]
MTANLIACLAYETARHFLLNPGEKSADGRPALRLKNLLPGEVGDLLELWTRHAHTDGLAAIRVVIARDSEIACDARYFADPDKSITWYRNHNETGLLYLQTKVESDEQGLESMFTVLDRNYLDGSLETQGFSPLRRLMQLGWEAVCGLGVEPPKQLPERLEIVRTALRDSGIAVSVRPFAAFVERAAREILAFRRSAIDEQTLDRGIGRALPMLQLFPDEAWSEDSDPRRRLALNFRLADLMNPAGVDQDPDELTELIERTIFKNGQQPLTGEELARWRRLCVAYVHERSDAAREAVPFAVYRQIFAKSAVTGVTLGDRVHEEILAAAPERITEFEALGVQDGLNRREGEAARALIEAVPPEDTPPLVDGLPMSTQKLLQRLAYPRNRSFDNIFTQIVEIIRSVPHEEAARCELRCGRLEEADRASLGLFAFLYGPSLAEMAEGSALQAPGILFVTDPELTSIVPPPEPRAREGHAEGTSDELEEGATDLPLTWTGVPLELRIMRADGTVLEENATLRWRPDDIEWLAFGWLMMAAVDAPRSDGPLEASTEWPDLVTQAAQRLTPLDRAFGAAGSNVAYASDPGIHELQRLRRDFLTEVARSGLSVSTLAAYAESWGELLHRLRGEYIPNGVLDPRLRLLAGQDVVHCNSRLRALMLMSHPLRLRWFSAYLRELMNVTMSALGGRLRLNSINETYYLDKLERLSAHGQPPMLATDARTLLVPVSEHGVAEAYAAIKQEGQITTLWKSELDETSLGDISQQVLEYLRAHPHKADGISLLFVLPSGGSVPGRVVQLIRKGEWRDLPVRCHVVAPRAKWPGVIEHFQVLETESRMAGAGRLNPPLQLELLDWQGEVSASQLLRQLSFDVAIVPNFFGDKVDVNEHAEAPRAGRGRFDPLYDAPVHVDVDADPGSVSIVLTPDMPDPVLDDWSTINVRLLRSEAIVPSSPEWTDFVKLRIRFEEAAALFSSLHECSHWVVTLDRYVGRSQIESLPQRPDVLTVREGVGQNGLATLVVSSNAGRKFVIQRLARKLERLSGSVSGLDVSKLATRIYDEIREVAPGLILRSMGISRITEEVLGLMVAKLIADREMPAPPGATSIWISLDEHSDWFGGDHGVRADLCRVDLARQDDPQTRMGRLQIGIVAVEGKLRQQFDPYGVAQASRAAALIRGGLAPRVEGSDENMADAHFWRRSILSALRGVSDKAAVHHVRSGGDAVAARLDIEDAIDIRAGSFEVVSQRALYSICLYERQGKLDREMLEGVTVFRSSAKHLLELVEANPALGGRAAPVRQNEAEMSEGTDSIAGGNTDLEPRSAVTVTTVKTPSLTSGPTATALRGGMGDARMQAAYQVVLDTLAEFKISVQTPDDGRSPFIEGPAFVQYRVLPARGVDPKRVAGCEDALRLALKLEEGKRLRFAIGGGTVNIDVPKLDADRYFVRAEDLWSAWSRPSSGQLAVPIGENQLGEVVAINFSSPNSPHLLIGGATGSGKSEALNTVLRGLTRFYSPDELRLVLVDPKQTELAPFEGSPHLLGQIGYFEDDAIECLEAAVEEMQSRYQRFRTERVRDLPEYNAKFPSDRLPWQVVVLDEYADLVSEGETRRQVEAAVKRLSQKARACGIHVIIATQKPSAENISTTVRSNLPAQLALKCRGVAESRVVMDEPGAETLNGKGDAFLKVGDRVERVQCALVK